MEDKCKICGETDKELKSDYLRELYYFKAQDKFDIALFIPRLLYSEKYLLQNGFNHICSNRTKCRKRMGW